MDDRSLTTPGPSVEATQAPPFSRQELRSLLRSPLRTMDVLLTQRQRFASNVALEHRLPTIGLVLFVMTALFALPFGAVLGLTSLWRVAVMWLGGLLICLPSLHIFGRYLGARLSWQQTLCVSLSGTAVASLFTFAFAPILGFLRVTMTDAQVVTPGAMAILLLVCALFAGIGQLLRLLRNEATLRGIGPSVGRVLLPWLALYVFITLRLASALGLFQDL